MKPKCSKCTLIIPGKIKINSYRKKIGRKSKNVVEYYCESCFSLVEKEKSWSINREKEMILQKMKIKRLQNYSKKK